MTPLAVGTMNAEVPDMTYDEKVAEFKARIDAGEKIEAGDWMPDEYRSAALKFIEMHANSEVMGALPEREWIPRAPTLKRKLSLTAKVQDEVGHGQILYRVAEDLGKSREAMFDDLVNGRTKFHNVFHYPTETWGDVAVIGWLIDGAALVTQKALLDSSYAPYVRAMRRICAEESLHLRHGEDLALELVSGTPAQREMFQDAVNRWWRPIMHFYGPPSNPAKDVLLYWGIKTRSNEDLRSEFFSTYVPKLWDVGITVPDEELRWDSRQNDWAWGSDGDWVDWDEFWTTVKGNGPMTGVRLGYRKAMWDVHAWVREAFEGIPAAA